MSIEFEFGSEADSGTEPEVEELVDQDRLDLEEELENLRSVSLSSTSLKSQLDFARNCFQRERLEAILGFNDKTGIPIAQLKKMDQVQHLILQSLINGERMDEAVIFAADPSRSWEKFPELHQEAFRFAIEESKKLR